MSPTSQQAAAGQHSDTDQPQLQLNSMGTNISNRGDVELGRMKNERDSSLSTIGRGTQQDDDDDTDYQPFNWKKFFLAPKHIPLWIVVIIFVIATVIITIKHDQVVDALRPFSEEVRDLPAGWLIPIAILFVISFPPLFGHEIIALLCGIVYGLWIGFGIVSAGTFFGEVGTWFAFKYLLRSKAAKWEKTNIDFAALARLTREGGFWIVLITRFSAIPSHMSTAIFATCGVNFWFFAFSTFLTLPKQLLLVYLGVLVIDTNTNNAPKYIALFVGGAVTAVMAWYIYRRMSKYKKILLEEQAERKRRRANKDSNSVSAAQPFLTGDPNNSAPQEQGQTYATSSQQQPGFYPQQQDHSHGYSQQSGYGPASQTTADYNHEYQLGYDARYSNSEQHLMREPARLQQMPPVETKPWV